MFACYSEGTVKFTDSLQEKNFNFQKKPTSSPSLRTQSINIMKAQKMKTLSFSK